MRDLLAFEADYRARLAQLENDLEKLRAERDRAMLRAHRAGIPVVEIARVFTVSHQRVSRILGPQR